MGEGVEGDWEPEVDIYLSIKPCVPYLQMFYGKM